MQKKQNQQHNSAKVMEEEMHIKKPIIDTKTPKSYFQRQTNPQAAEISTLLKSIKLEKE